MTDDQFEAWLKSSDGGECVTVKILPEGIYGGVRRLLFHWTLIIGDVGDQISYLDRYCYQADEAANRALLAWDGTQEPEGWHRHPYSGRRRPESDASREYVAA